MNQEAGWTASYFRSLPSVIAVVSFPDAKLAAEAAMALMDGGIRAIELALRNDAALDAIRKIEKQVPGMIIGAGTVLREDQIPAVIDAGASFAVAPGFNPRVVETALLKKLPFAPGIATPSEIEIALSLGISVMKVFPAKYLGGLEYMKSMAAPFDHLGIGFIPLGGLAAEDLTPYLKEKIIVSVGGSWIAQKKDIEERNWNRIREKAEEAVHLVKQIGGRI
ncbi:bifunctional 4-hydroxy-2-oxoglutarate aldolase/2-dehydro-3-deoxy-phosphogluconate aldolase [Treponema sp. OttesenSCG-928-L16]|nr:bifunctional 4-hydroxy-2-oxoglutarate aldolase/2-dehydro-3-deoxy-phosphogluconate aldolase [Treponema sp. OttesenSCG-928-L16]